MRSFYIIICLLLAGLALVPNDASAGVRICGATAGIPGMVSVVFNARPVPQHLTPRPTDFRRGVNAYVHPTARKPDMAVKIRGVYYVLDGGSNFYQHLAGRKIQITWRMC